MNRRKFLAMAGAATGAAVLTRADSSPIRAAVIGHTNRGDYGHGMDRVFDQRAGIACVAVVDPDPAGRAAAVKRLGTVRGYAGVDEMLSAEKPALVSIAMRQADQHHAMGLACLRAGAHCVFEKPFTRSPVESDELLAEAGRRGLRIAVAHTMKLSGPVQRLRTAIAGGLLGELVELRAYGKQDSRAGGEDLMVLGTHLFDLFRLYCGDPEWVNASVQAGGRPVTRTDRRLVADNIGWVAGDQVFATFGFGKGVHATFTSDARLRETTGPWGIEILGRRGAARVQCDLAPKVFIRSTNPWSVNGRTEEWKPLTGEPPDAPATPEHHVALVDDWLEAIREKREPQCSGRDGAWAVEMVAGIYASSLSGRTLRFPLETRTHPLAD